MKLKLKPLQARILVQLGTAREMPFDQLAKALMPAREMQGMSLAEWDNEIRLNIDSETAAVEAVAAKLKRPVSLLMA